MIGGLYLKLGVVAVLVLAVLWGAHWLFQRGVDSATIAITKSNTEAGGKADSAERDVLACPAGKWNREAEKCER